MSDDARACRHYLLAAGHGRRSGGPKAWRGFDGVSLLARHVEFARTHFDETDLVVAIQSGWRGRCESLSPLVRWVSVDPDAPPLASLLSLLRVVPLDRWSFVYHVDMPLWEAALFERLAARARGDPRVDAVVPTYEGKGGHPVLISPATAGAVAALDAATDRLDHWLRTRNVARIAVSSPTVLENWNRPAAASDE